MHWAVTKANDVPGIVDQKSLRACSGLHLGPLAAVFCLADDTRM